MKVAHRETFARAWCNQRWSIVFASSLSILALLFSAGAFYLLVKTLTDEWRRSEKDRALLHKTPQELQYDLAQINKTILSLKDKRSSLQDERAEAASKLMMKQRDSEKIKDDLNDKQVKLSKQASSQEIQDMINEAMKHGITITFDENGWPTFESHREAPWHILDNGYNGRICSSFNKAISFLKGTCPSPALVKQLRAEVDTCRNQLKNITDEADRIQTTLKDIEKDISKTKEYLSDATQRADTLEKTKTMGAQIIGKSFTLIHVVEYGSLGGCLFMLGMQLIVRACLLSGLYCKLSFQ